MTKPAVDVSVIVAVRNGAATLAQCIDTVLAQTGCVVEIIIVDAMSDDGTQEIVECFSDRIATYIREPDRGIYDAWNKAVKVARGEWCIFLGSDDKFADSASLQILLHSAASLGDQCVLAFGGVLRLGWGNDFLDHPTQRQATRRIRRGALPCHQGVIQRTKDVVAVGFFDSSLQIAGDADMLMRLAARGGLARAPHVVSLMRAGGISNSPATQKVAVAERRVVLLRHRGAVRGTVSFVWARASDSMGKFFEMLTYRILPKRLAIRVALLGRRALGRNLRVMSP